MYVITVVPFSKIPFPAPQTLDYFCNQIVEVGGIVEILISSRKLLGIAVSCSRISDQKIRIKKSPYKLKPIQRVINAQCVYPRQYIKLALWTSMYYYSPTGLIAKTLFPQFFSKPTIKFLKELSEIKPAPDETEINHEKGGVPVLARGNIAQQISYFSKNIDKAIKNKKSVLFIVPEIYKIDYYITKIPLLRKAAMVTGKLTEKEQYEIWKVSISNKSVLIIGTRAALSMHIKNLGLIILDEEESPYHKSFDQQPYINTKNLAIKLAELSRSKIILGSYVPSIESAWQAKNGEFTKAALRIPRAKSGQNRQIRLVDMRQELKNGNYSIFSMELQKKLTSTIQNGEQAILFINRKGLSTGLLCRDCGHIVKCPNCDVPMTYYRTHPAQNNLYKLACHHCALSKNPPTVCPKCQSYRIKFIGTGTQRVKEELEKFCARNKLKCSMSIIDTLHTQGWEEQQDKFDLFRQKKISVLIGTQLMLKTGILPKCRLCAAITIDPMLAIPDFRMSERIFGIIRKLMENSSSEILIQTYNPESYSLKNILESFGKQNSFETFSEKELEMRKVLSLPPFSNIIKISYSHPNPQKAEGEAKVLLNKLKLQAENCRIPAVDYDILGPAPAFVSRQKNRYIWHIMIKSKIQNLILRNKLLRVVPSGWKIDIDPIEIL